VASCPRPWRVGMGWACGSGYNKAHPSAPRLIGLSEDGEGSDNGITCLSIYIFFFVKSHPRMKNSDLMFHVIDAPNAQCDTQISPDAKHKFSITCPGVLFVKSVPAPAEHKK
jgi:hypothetical protein